MRGSCESGRRKPFRNYPERESKTDTGVRKPRLGTILESIGAFGNHNFMGLLYLNSHFYNCNVVSREIDLISYHEVD